MVYRHPTHFWTLRTRHWDFGGLSAKNGWGEAFSGMITTLFRGHPEQYLHTLARTRHTPLQNKPPYAEVWALGVSASPSPCTAGIFGFDAWKMLHFRFWQVLKPSWRHLRFAQYLQRLRAIRPPVVEQFLPRRVCNSQLTPAAVAVLGHEPLQLHRL